jgi:NADH:ubiquinone oxidoreductase subunit 5 (subunit L)/multisubunit Na+/H+ antiporter MnhA subunit
LFIGLGTDFWANSIFNLYLNMDILYAEFLDYYYKLIPLVFSLAGVAASLAVYFYLYEWTLIIIKSENLRTIYRFLSKKWYFDLLYNNIFVFNLLKGFYTLTFKLIDRGLIEFFGPLSLVRLINKASFSLSYIQTGLLYNYIFVVLLGVIFFIAITTALFFNELELDLNLGLLICFIVCTLFSTFFSNSGNKRF